MGKLAALLLGLWLIAKGVLSLAHLHLPGSSVILDVLAVVAGVLLILRR
jgi:ABC-type thiamin/hydroxymethylpyrimidine transport system permease subunit